MAADRFVQMWGNALSTYLHAALNASTDREALGYIHKARIADVRLRIAAQAYSDSLIARPRNGAIA